MEADQVVLPRYIVHPHDVVAQSWWAFILLTGESSVWLV